MLNISTDQPQGRKKNSPKRKADSAEKDPTLMTKEEFFAKIDKGLEEYKQGKYISFDTNEEMFAFLENL
jgi:hypothetical protein